MRHINRTLFKKNTKDEINLELTSWRDYYYDGYYSYYNNQDEYDKYYDSHYNYGYHENKDGLNIPLLSNMTYNIKGRLSNFSHYRHIDLNSVYNSKIDIRDRKLNDLLGLPNNRYILTKTLLEDLIKIDKDGKSNT